MPRRTLALFLGSGLFLLVVLLFAPVRGQEPPAAGADTAPATSAAPAEAKPVDGRTSLAALKSGGGIGSTFGQKFQSLLGLGVIIGGCWLASKSRPHVNWRLVGWGLGLQIAFGYLIICDFPGLGFPLLRGLFTLVNDGFTSLMSCTEVGASFLFGNLSKVNNVPAGGGGPFGPVSSTGQVAEVGAFFAFGVLPTIIFFSSFMAVLYHVGVMQAVVKGIAWVMQRTMKTSGSETLCASGNIFVGQTEAPLLIRPFVPKMTESELMAVMVAGFATVAGGVMAAYVGMLKANFSDIAGHLLSASVMSAPAALVCAKLLVPEPDPTASETYGELKVELEKVDANVIDAAARGAGDGLKLALNVGAMLLAFIALIALLNGLLNWTCNVGADVIYGKTWSARLAAAQKSWDALDAGSSPDARAAAEKRLADLAREAAAEAGVADAQLVFEPARAEAARDGATIRFGPGALVPGERPALRGIEPRALSATEVEARGTGERTLRSIRFEVILGWLLAPLAWLMGVPFGPDCVRVGELVGVKTVVNEFVAYLNLGGMVAGGQLEHPRSVIISTYALCGFANFSSIAIQIGGISGIAPERRSDLAKLGIKAMIAGNLACFMTACVAGLLI